MKTIGKSFLAGMLLPAVCICMNAIPQAEDFDVRHIGYAEGLSSQRVFSIVEDRNSAMWFSTKEGIDRYNGREVSNYTLPGDLYYGDKAGMRIWLQCDAGGKLWAYIHTGRIYRYSESGDCFELVIDLKKLIEGEIILNCLHVCDDGEMWAGLGSGLYRISENGDITRTVSDHYINCIIPVGNMIYAGASDGLICYDPKAPDRYEMPVSGPAILSLYHEAGSRNILAGTFNKGLLSIDIVSGTAAGISGADAALTNPIRVVTGCGSGTVLAGVDGGGVYAVDPASGKCSLFANSSDDSTISLKGNGIYAVTKDRQGNFWIGSYTGGVSMAVLKENDLDVYSHIKSSGQSLANNNVNGVTENAEGDIWFATDDGISILHGRTSSWTHTLGKTVAMTFCPLNDGSVWTGTYGSGIYLIDSDGNILRHLENGDGGLTTNYIFSIASDPEGNLWAGGLEGDLLEMDKDGNPLRTFGIKWINTIQYAGNGKMAAATVDGLWIVDIATGNTTQYASSEEFRDRNVSAYIISVLLNGDGTVWLGTEGGGLNLYNMIDRTVRTFSSADGLPSDDVFSVQKDGAGRVWVSTGRGIAMIENGRILTAHYINETEREYNKSSFARLSDGRFIYGSTNGAICFSPEEIGFPEYDAPLRFTRLSIDYLNKGEAAELQPDLYSMIQDGEVRLGYRHNSFTVGFESINHRFQQDIVYQYKLNGYEKEWNSPVENGSVRYINVSPGKYTLEVRSLRNSNGSVISENSLGIKIRQPWWNSWYAWFIYILGSFAVLTFVFRYKRNQMQKQYDEDKIRFFIDTAHNIRTPVTLIMAPLEDLGKDTGLSEKSRYCLDLARTNTDKLHTLISKLLEFERSDISGRNIRLAPVNLTAVFTDEAASFLSNYGQRQLTLEVSSPDEDIYVLAERHLIEIICDNLLSNAFKYSKPGGTVRFSLEPGPKSAVIKVSDNGIGIPEKDRKHIFRDVYRAGNAMKHEAVGTGFGLLMVYRTVKKLGGKMSFKSEEGKGTVFTVMLKTIAVPSDGREERKAVLQPLPSGGRTPEDTVLEGKHEETILIVEDHAPLRQYLRRLFEQDYNVADAAGGEEALSYLEKDYPDIILSDLMMPGIQGDELCRIIKENPETSGIPFILLTARTNDESIMSGLKKGADDYIQKPFRSDILKLKIGGFLENRKRLRTFLLHQVLRQAGSEEQTDDQTPADNIAENDRQFVDRATQIVLSRMGEPDFGINDLCHEMAMSRTLFYGRIKSLTGQGPQEFIRLIRLQKAAELLRNGKSVADASAETGFVNAKYFSTLFRKQFGIQPSRYVGKTQ